MMLVRATMMALGLAVAVAACAAEPERSDDDDDGGVTSASTSVGQGGATSGTGGQPATTGAGGGTTADTSLYPLAVGNTWTYDVVAVGAGSVCASGAHTTTILGTDTVDGREAFETTNWCSGVSGTDFIADGDGDEVLFNYSGDWLRLIAEPIQAGYSWPYFNTSYTWESAGSVTVPAGTFDDCWTARQDVTYTAYQTYCRGVGLVESYSQDLAGNGWNARLQSKSF